MAVSKMITLFEALDARLSRKSSKKVPTSSSSNLCPCPDSLDTTSAHDDLSIKTPSSLEEDGQALSTYSSCSSSFTCPPSPSLSFSTRSVVSSTLSTPTPSSSPGKTASLSSQRAVLRKPLPISKSKSKSRPHTPVTPTLRPRLLRRQPSMIDLALAAEISSSTGPEFRGLDLLEPRPLLLPSPATMFSLPESRINCFDFGFGNVVFMDVELPREQKMMGSEYVWDGAAVVMKTIGPSFEVAMDGIFEVLDSGRDQW